MEITSRRRRALATALALVLAVESVSAVAVAAHVATGSALRATAASALPVPPDGDVLAEDSRLAVDGLVAVGVERRVGAWTTVERPAQPAAEVVASPGSAGAGRVAVQNVAKAAVSGNGRSGPASSATYKGRNHVWIPWLGINRSVHWFSCDRSRPPDNYVYRWGCAGRNNVYLLGHAYSVFEPLHDAYVSGRLHKGMKAWYADPKGRVHVYAVRWWKVVRPTTSASWAWAAQRVPSMTLQTCVGRNSEYRLMVRLVEVNG